MTMNTTDPEFLSDFEFLTGDTSVVAISLGEIDNRPVVQVMDSSEEGLETSYYLYDGKNWNYLSDIEQWLNT